jgi:FkbM family methyltransferase
MRIQRIIRKLKANYDILLGKAQYSYSQFGEDILVDSFFKLALKKTNPTYLDIGANNPIGGNNTYYFYLKKSKGVCIEPDVTLYNKIVSKRPNDTVLNVGVGINDLKEGVFYYFPEPYTGWNTFSKEDAEEKKLQSGISFKQDKVIPFVNINDIIKEHFDSAPDFISIDVEGLDFDIIKSMNFDKDKPLVFCIETMEFGGDGLGKKKYDVQNFLIENGYVVYADTYINTIFVRKDLI